MLTQPYVTKGKWVTEHLGPINAIMLITTGILVPVFDIASPNFPFSKVAFLLGGLVLIMIVMKIFRVPPKLLLPNSLVLIAFLCAVLFGAGAFASYKHEREGGVLAGHIKGFAELQKILLDIKDGKSSDPRVELANLGVPWEFNKFILAADNGDVRAVELFLKGGMPVIRDDGRDIISVPHRVATAGYANSPEILALFSKYKIDLNDPELVPEYLYASSVRPPNLYVAALAEGKKDAAAKLAELGVDTSGYDAYKKQKTEFDKKPKIVFFGI